MIIGVVSNLRDTFEKEPYPTVYVADSQLAKTNSYLIIRSASGAEAAIDKSIAAIDPFIATPITVSLSSLIFED